MSTQDQEATMARAATIRAKDALAKAEAEWVKVKAKVTEAEARAQAKVTEAEAWAKAVRAEAEAALAKEVWEALAEAALAKAKMELAAWEEWKMAEVRAKDAAMVCEKALTAAREAVAKEAM